MLPLVQGSVKPGLAGGVSSIGPLQGVDGGGLRDLGRAGQRVARDCLTRPGRSLQWYLSAIHAFHVCMKGGEMMGERREGMPRSLDDAFQGSVTVGERGQVVIPAAVREKLGINPGDKLLVLQGPSGHGILFARLQDLEGIVKDLMPLIMPLIEAATAAEADQEDETTRKDG